MAETGMRRAVVVGFDYYGRFLAKLINQFSRRWTLSYFGSSRLETVRASIAALSADAIVCFGGPGPNLALVEIARSRNIPVIVIWAGTDVISARQEPQLLEVIKGYGFFNVSDGPWLVDELRELGIQARYVPVTAVDPVENVVPLPEPFSVLTYLPQPRRAFYGEKLIYSIARQFPDVPFRVVGSGDPNPAAPRNVDFLGYVHDMPQWIDRSTVLLRLPEHDGKSMLVLEALARGRHVIWNYDFPGVHFAQREAEAVAVLRHLKELNEAGLLRPNVAAVDFARENFTRERLARGFEAVLDEARPAGEGMPEERRRVAISGLNLFVAQVAQSVARYDPRWDPRIIRTSVRLEVLTSMLTMIGADVWYSIGAPISDRWLHLFSRILRKPRVIHWVGSDITSLYTNPHLRWLSTRPNVRNLAEVDWTIEELRKLGIEATLAPLPPRLPAVSEPTPLPKRFTVLLYLPKTRGEFYGRREYERLIRAFAKRGVRFLIVGGGECYAPPEADVVQLGWRVDLDEIYRDSSVLVRFTKHDGLSIMVLEALTHGRHVLWSQDFPFATQVRTYDEIAEEIELLLTLHERGELHVRLDAARYVTETYGTKRCIARLTETWGRVAPPRRPRRMLAMETQP